MPVLPYLDLGVAARACGQCGKGGGACHRGIGLGGLGDGLDHVGDGVGKERLGEGHKGHKSGQWDRWGVGEPGSGTTRRSSRRGDVVADVLTAGSTTVTVRAMPGGRRCRRRD